MMRIVEQDSRKKQCGTATKFIITDNGAMDSDLIPYMPHNLTINELGKQLLKAATDGKVEEIRMLMSKGAPFTADWLGTSPLHLAAQNNHLEVCEILIRAGMSRDARTKVDRTPLHMAVYEGHEDIVECLLKNGADYDCKDLLHMTPLHWAAQNGFAKIAATLIRYGAATHCQNKFNLTPAEIAMQIDRLDIVQIINLGIRDPLVAQLALDMMSESSTQAAVEPILNLDNSNDVDDADSNDVTPLPIETVMVEDETDNSLGIESGHYEEVQEEVSQEEAESIECEANYSDSLKLLQQHGITMLPVDENNILNSVMETGHSVVLTEAGKQALNSIKTSETNEELSEYLKTKTGALNPIRKNKIITVTAEEFLAMTNNGTLTSQPNILRQINGKVVNNLQKPLQTKRIVMKKNKVMSISPTVNVTKVPKVENSLDVESLLEELQKARTLIEYYKEKLSKKDQELSRCKQQIKVLQIAAKHNS